MTTTQFLILTIVHAWSINEQKIATVGNANRDKGKI